MTGKTPANGNYIGTCTNIIGEANICSGVYNIDQLYDITTNTQVATGPCAGSISLIDPSTGSVVDQSVTGGTGAYKGATGNAIITLLTDCPEGSGPTTCYKIDFNLD